MTVPMTHSDGVFNVRRFILRTLKQKPWRRKVRCLRTVSWFWLTWSTGCSSASVTTRTAHQTPGTGRQSAAWGPVWSGGHRLELDQYFVSNLRNQINESLKCYRVSDTDFLVSKSDVQVWLWLLSFSFFAILLFTFLLMQIHNICNGMLSELKTTKTDEFMHLSGVWVLCKLCFLASAWVSSSS